jgi:uncharacterized membrane protein YphA (DoxX/SURF4 family)
VAVARAMHAELHPQKDAAARCYRADQTLGRVYSWADLRFKAANSPAKFSKQILIFISVFRIKTYVVGALEVAGGVLLLFGRWVPLGLALLGPVIVNIFLYHALMAPANLPMAIIISVLALFLLWYHRASFAGIVK